MATNRWNLRGASTNEYIVAPKIRKEVYYRSEFGTLFGRVNEFREVSIIDIERGDSKLKITGKGLESPVWEQDFGDETGEARFTRIAPMAGLPTYGQSDPLVGEFDNFKHEVIHVNQVDSPVQPLLDKESQRRQTEVISIGDVIGMKKTQMKLWREKQIEFDAFRALNDGYSRGLLTSANGGMNLALPGATAGQNRSNYNTVVAAEFALTTPNYTRATHEGTLATLVNAMTDQAVHNFDYEEHKFMSGSVIPSVKLKPVTIGGRQYRAFAIADPDCMYRLGAYGGTLETMLRQANERAMQNPTLKGLEAWELDDILYVASQYMKYFRPTTDGTTMTYLSSTTDPLGSSFSNTSKLVQIHYLGAGALCRGRRKDIYFSVSGEGTPDAGHRKGTTYCLHYFDGWKRTEWCTKDGTSAIENDSSICWYGYDPGIGKSPAA